MLKSKEEQLDLLIKEIKATRVKAVTIRQYLGSSLIRKSNYKLDSENKFVLGYKENKKVTLTVEGKDFFLYNEDISVLYFQEVWSYDDGYDIQCTCKGVTSNISITTA